MRPLRFTSVAALSCVSLVASLAGAQTAPPAGAAPPATDPAAVDAGKSAALQRLEERLRALSTGRGLTAAETARRTVARSPTLEARKRAVEATNAGVTQAKSGYWPRLNLSASYTRLSEIEAPTLGNGGSLVATNAPPGVIDPTTLTNDPTVPNGTLLVSTPPLSFPVVLDNYVFAAKLTVPISDYFLRTGNSVAAANRSHEASKFEEMATRSDLERNARVAYYQWVRAQANELIAEQTLEQAKGHYSDVKNSFEAGLVSKADVLRLETEVKGAELLRERAKHGVELAAIGLGVLMGDPPGTKYDVGEDVFAPAPALEKLPTPTAAYAEAVAHRPELKALERAETALREQAKVARAANYPRLDAQANALYANPNPRYFPQREEFHGTWDAGIALSYTPTDIPGAQSQTSVIEARAMEVAAQRRAFYEALRLDVNQVLRLAVEARFEIGVSRDAAASAEESYRVRRELYRAGRATTVEVTDAETSLARARSALVDAHVAGRIALVELDHTLGRTGGAKR